MDEWNVYGGMNQIRFELKNVKCKQNEKYELKSMNTQVLHASSDLLSAKNRQTTQQCFKREEFYIQEKKKYHEKELKVENRKLCWNKQLFGDDYCWENIQY